MSKCVKITGYVEEKGKQAFSIGQTISLGDDDADRLVRVKAAVFVDKETVATLVNQVGEDTFRDQANEIKNLTTTVEAISKKIGVLKTENDQLKLENDQLKKQIKELQDKKGKEKESK